MVTVYRARGWKIAVYGREHGVPHFHIEGPGFRCSVDLRTLELIVGTAPMAVIEEGRRWAKANQRALFAKWQELNP